MCAPPRVAMRALLASRYALSSRSFRTSLLTLLQSSAVLDACRNVAGTPRALAPECDPRSERVIVFLSASVLKLLLAAHGTKEKICTPREKSATSDTRRVFIGATESDGGFARKMTRKLQKKRKRVDNLRQLNPLSVAQRTENGHPASPPPPNARFDPAAVA